MVKAIVLFTFLTAVGAAATVAGEEHHSAAQALIVAEPSSVTLLEDLGAPNEVIFKRLYRVTLKKVRVLSGSASVPGTLTVKMTGAEDGVIRKHMQVAILLQLDEHQEPEVLYWEPTYTIACVPHDLVTEGNLPAQDFDFSRRGTMDCALADYLH